MCVRYSPLAREPLRCPGCPRHSTHLWNILRNTSSPRFGLAFAERDRKSVPPPTLGLGLERIPGFTYNLHSEKAFFVRFHPCSWSLIRYKPTVPKKSELRVRKFVIREVYGGSNHFVCRFSASVKMAYALSSYRGATREVTFSAFVSPQ